MNEMDRQVLLKQVLVNNGVVPATASDGDVATADAALRSSDPVKYNAMLVAGGVPPAPGMSMLTWLGLGAGAVALYLLWKNYTKTKKLDAVDYPESDEDNGGRLHNMSRALGHFRGGSKSFKGARKFGSCSNGLPSPRKYQFEPETRLEGYRKLKSRSRR